MSNSHKSTKRMADGQYYCAAMQIPSSNCSGSKTSTAFEYVEVKQEIIEDQERHQGGEQNILSEKSELEENFISSVNESAFRTENVYKYDETLVIKKEVIQDQETHQGGEENLISEKNHLDEKSISSVNNSADKSSIIYEHETLEIKEEVFEDQESHQGGKQNLLSEKNQFDKKSISAVSESVVKIENLYKYEETLEIKEEVIQDPETVTDQTLNRKYESALNSIDTREAESSEKLRTHKKKKIKGSKPQLEKEYNCGKCARGYKRISSLINHQRFECGVTPQFICKICDKPFKRKSHVNRHVIEVHQKTNSNQKKQKMLGTKQIPERKHNIHSHINKRHQKINSYKSQTQYICDKCPRSYSSLSGLNIHKRSKHAAIKPEFICDVCGFRTSMKCNLSQHIYYRHLTNSSQAWHNCYKCFVSYSTLNGLRYHNLVKHTAHKPKFTCDICNYRTHTKSQVTIHISSRHLKASRTPQARHNCDKCFLSYISLSGLNRHKRLKHAASKPQFFCDFCNYKTSRKSSVASHISLLHLKTSNTSQARHNCDKCFLNYSSVGALKHHKRLKHAEVKPKEFICDFCSYKTYEKSHLSTHIFSRHFKNTSQARHNCDKCNRSYSSTSALRKHDRLKHAAAKLQFIRDV